MCNKLSETAVSIANLLKMKLESMEYRVAKGDVCMCCDKLQSVAIDIRQTNAYKSINLLLRFHRVFNLVPKFPFR